MIDNVHRGNFNWTTYDSYADAVMSKHELYGTLLNSKALLRLKDVSFLGALELFTNDPNPPSKNRDSRYKHTVGVSYLMFRAAKALRLNEKQERQLVAAAILHDVGHGALSHSIEAYFKNRFAVSHKHFTTRLVIGDLLIGDEITRILRQADIDPDLIAELISDKEAALEFQYLLHSSINVDTIDGISRAARFFDHRGHTRSPENVLGVLTDPSPITQSQGDNFWRLKDRIYNSFIFKAKWAVFDAMITRVLALAHDRIQPDDFLLSDTDFKQKFRHELDDVRTKYVKRRNELLFDLRRRAELDHDDRTREFSIEQDIELTSAKDINKRYLDKKASNVARPRI